MPAATPVSNLRPLSIVFTLFLILTSVFPAFAASAFSLQPSAIQSSVTPPRTWTYTGSMHTSREYHTATLLQDGRVLVVGGDDGNSFNVLSSSVVYDPASGMWTLSGNLHNARIYHTATRLQNGQVLVVAGMYWPGTAGHLLNSSELYDPATGVWIVTAGKLTDSLEDHTATLLPNGQVLVAGGYSANTGVTASSELYDPASGVWTLSGSLHNARWGQTATLLPNGQVLVAGGDNYTASNLDSTEVYDPATGKWAVTGSLNIARDTHTATGLQNGSVLIAGGLNSDNGLGLTLSSSELASISRLFVRFLPFGLHRSSHAT